jgi:predicted aspartyl protease
METPTMGKVIVPAMIENLCDLYNADERLLSASKVRRVEVRDAVVDTGAINLSLPKRLIAQLGLDRVRTRRILAASGFVDSGMYDAVRLTIQGRDCVIDVLEVPDDCPVLIGRVPLELMDWGVDSGSGKLIGNPAHGGEWMTDQF